MKKRLLSMLLAIVMVVGLLPAVSLTASAADAAATASIAEGHITISKEGDTQIKVTHEGFQNGYIIIDKDAALLITGASDAEKDYGITVESGIANIILQDVSITRSGQNTPPIRIHSGATLNLVLAGNNVLFNSSNQSIIDTTSGETNAGIHLPEGATLNIGGEGVLTVTGGLASAGIGTSPKGTAGTLVINSGTVTATGGEYGAGIGGGNLGIGGTVTINGGTVTATGRQYGAGIGGGDEGAGGTVTINGGTVTAEGGTRGAGIGGGGKGAGGTVIINNGTVNATSSYGAGIGGGYCGAGGTITINGGAVTATSSSYGAGIGGGGASTLENGDAGNGGTIAISGGIVTATGVCGAGIGGGGVSADYSGYTAMAGAGGTITISGGTVVAQSTGSYGGAGIGSGGSRYGVGNSGGTVVITGGNINATSTGGEAIGKGCNGTDSGTLKDANGNSLTLNTLTLDGAAADTAVTKVEGVTYGLADVKTLDDGKLYFWLPDGSVASSITAGENKYICNENLTYHTAHDWRNRNGICANGCGTECAHEDQTGSTCAICGATPHTHDWNYELDGADTIKATCTANDCPNENKSGGSVTIAAPTGLTYTGSAIEAEITNTLTTGDTVTVVYSGSGLVNGKPVHAGSYTAGITLGEGDDAATAAVDFTIGKANASVTAAPTPNALTYNGGVHALVTAGTATGGTMQYALGVDSTTAPTTGWSNTVPTGTDAGTYYVWYKVVGDPGYNDTAPVNVTVTVLQAPLTITAKNQGITYGMSIFQGTSNVIVTGLMSGDTLTGITLTASGQNVGHWVITPSNATISGSADNYDITYETGALTISTAMHDDLTAEQQKLLSNTAGDYTFDVSTVSGFPADGGTLSFAVTQDGNYAKAAIPDFVGSVLHYTVATPQSKDTPDNIVVTVSSTNYAPFDVTIPVIFVDAAEVAAPTGVPDTITYGDSFTLNAIAMNSGDNGVWTWTSSDPSVLQIDTVSGGGNISEARVTAVGVGSGVTITAKYVSDVSVGSASTASLTVGKAALTVKPKNISIYNGAAMPTPEVEYVGLKNGDAGATVATLDSGTLAMEIKAADGTTALADTTVNGTYQIVFTGNPEFDVSDKYEITTGNGTLTISTRPNSGGGGGYTPPVRNVTVPISGDDNTIHVGASVNGDKATVKNVDLDHLDTVIGDHVDTGTVTIDFSGLNSSKPITTVEIPSDVVKEIAAAVSDPSNDAHSFEVILSDGTSIEFDAVALGEKAAQADGLDITISIEHYEDAKLTSAQKNAVGNRPAFDINVTSGGEHISDMGGKITVHAPYELKAGEKARGIVVWYVDDHGNRERCETSYDPIKQRVNWKTDHLSLYMIEYDEALANNPFTDVSSDAYYFNAVLWAVDNGITNGTSATTFSPDASCTRAQMATFLWRAAGSPDPVGSTNPFTDVSAEAYYAKAVQWAVEQGITKGTGDGTTFSPDMDCTRAQMATFLWRNAGSPAPTGSTNPFADVPAEAYYATAVQWAYEQEITGGTSATTFSPDADCTRAQMVTFLYRFFVK